LSVFPNWQNFAVMQRRAQTGCIPTGYEMILRAAGATGIDFKTFQDDFDLEKDLPENAPRLNDFGSVAQAVRKKYPSVVFDFQTFAKGKGAAKLAFVEDRIRLGQPFLVSLALPPPGGGWHIMPVVDADDGSLTLLWSISADGRPDLRKLLKSDLVRIHDTHPGGEEVAYLESC
jgi:hypothetical protein